MITVDDVDRLVVSNDGVAARVWPRLGARVRKAYITDRDHWTAIRRKSAGGTIPPATLASEHKVFSSWARGFQAVAARRPAARRTQAASPTARPIATAQPAALTTPAPPTAPSSKGHAALIAGGILFAGVAAFAAGRRRG